MTQAAITARVVLQLCAWAHEPAQPEARHVPQPCARAGGGQVGHHGTHQRLAYRRTDSAVSKAQACCGIHNA